MCNVENREVEITDILSRCVEWICLLTNESWNCYYWGHLGSRVTKNRTPRGCGNPKEGCQGMGLENARGMGGGVWSLLMRENHSLEFQWRVVAWHPLSKHPLSLRRVGHQSTRGKSWRMCDGELLILQGQGIGCVLCLVWRSRLVLWVEFCRDQYCWINLLMEGSRIPFSIVFSISILPLHTNWCGHAEHPFTWRGAKIETSWRKNMECHVFCGTLFTRRLTRIN